MSEHLPPKVGETLTFDYGDTLTVTALGNVEITVKGQKIMLAPGETKTFENDGIVPISITRYE